MGSDETKDGGFTPGPWHADTPGVVGKRYAQGGQRTICLVRGYPLAEDQANMRLIAAAPDLLDMLRAAHSILIQFTDYQAGEWCPRIEAAIAKATGGAR